MRRALLPLLLLLAACSVAHGSDDLVWRTSAAQAMSFVREQPARDETCRQVLRLSAGGERVRLRLSNVLSETPLRVSALTVGLRAQGAAAEPGSLRTVTVAGERAFVVPPGEQVTTDPVVLSTAGGDDVLVSFAVEGTSLLTGHEFGPLTGWCTGPGTGDHTRDVGAGAFPDVGDRAGLVVEDVAVATAPGTVRAVVATGDSLTDAPLAPDLHRRWPEVLAEELGAVPVANAAIAGNRVVLDGGYGSPLVQRFDRDVLDRPGVGTVVLLAGTNDLSRDLGAARLIDALDRLVDDAQDDGRRVVLVTIPPTEERAPAQRLARHEVNEWIRSSSSADLVVDADLVLRSPVDDEALRPAFDHGDGLHLSQAGHRALGRAIAGALKAARP